MKCNSPYACLLLTATWVEPVWAGPGPERGPFRGQKGTSEELGGVGTLGTRSRTCGKNEEGKI